MSDIIPSSKCKILWIYDEHWNVTDVAIIDRRNPETDEQRRFPSSLGAICQGWDDGSDPALTPAGVFGRLLLRGFATDEHMVRALREFAKIDSAEWARQMLSVAEDIHDWNIQVAE